MLLMRSKISHLFVVICVVVFPQFASGSQCAAKVYFGNGIATPEEDAQKTRDIVRRVINQAFITTGRQPLAFDCFDYAYATDSRIPYLGDLIESAVQIVLDDYSKFWQWLANRGSDPPNTFVQAVQTAFASVSAVEYATSTDLQLQVQKYRTTIDAEQTRVVVIAHSQGNLFANQAFAALTTGADGFAPISRERFRITAVATPQSFVATGDSWTTMYGDIILLVPGRLEANTDTDGTDCDSIIYSPIACHLFDSSYFVDTSVHSRPRIINQVLSQIPVDTPLVLGGPWPMFGHDPQHTGQSLFVGPQTNAIKWTLPIVMTGIVVGMNETIYGVSGGRLYAIDKHGSVIWGPLINSSTGLTTPAIAPDGTIYVASGFGSFYAVRPDGTQKWVLSIGSLPPFNNAPVIVPDGTLYIGNSTGQVVAINPNGSEKWRAFLGSRSTSSPAVDFDGTIYATSVRSSFERLSQLFALDSTGIEKWHLLFGPGRFPLPVVGPDGTIYIPGEGMVRALYPDGTLKWFWSRNFDLVSSPALATDGTLYVSSFRNILTAINPDGTLKWHYIEDSTGGFGWFSPVIGADGIVYLADPEGENRNKLFAINPDGSTKWIRTLNNDTVASSPVIGSEGTLYIGGSNFGGAGGTFYAIGP